MHGGLGKPLAEGKWPGYSKQFLAAVDAAMTVKPDDRPQSITEWLAMFGQSGKPKMVAGADEDATRFYTPRDVATEEIVPVAAPEGATGAPLETGVPADPSEAQFKRLGEETGASKKRKAEPAKEVEAEAEPVAAAAASAAAPVRAKREPATAATPAAKPKPAVLAGGAAVLLLAAVGGWAMFGRGGSGPANAPVEAGPQADTSVLEGPTPQGNTATDLAAANAMQEVASNTAATAPAAQDSAQLAALKKQAAKAAAAEARLAEIRKAQQAAKTASATTTTAKPGAAAKEITSTPSTGGVSPGKLAQLDGIVDDARGMAKQVMRSGNSANAALARNYDSNLKTLKASARGVSSDKELDRLIKQANQTRAYVKFLVQQR
jgi:hypothetical protein